MAPGGASGGPGPRVSPAVILGSSPNPCILQFTPLKWGKNCFSPGLLFEVERDHLVSPRVVGV